MDKTRQLYVFIISITLLFTDINLTDNFQHSWFDAQSHCIGQGLTIERHKSDKPYWTGKYRRLTPWINILGCYSIESLHDVMNKTMIKSSVGICQEICHHEHIDKFAVKMNNCLCIKSSITVNPFNRISPSKCDFACEDNSDDIYPGDCGGRNAYNIYEVQEVNFTSKERCLSLQCSPAAKYLSPHKCFDSLDSVCENMRKPDNGNANSWNVSMEQCKNSHSPYYLLGNISLDDPQYICKIIIHRSQVVWIGVVRQIYTSIDQGWGIYEEEHDTFLKCQMCTNNECNFKNCLDSSFGSIFCKSKATTSQSDSDGLALKISLPVITIFIILLVSAVAVVLYKRRKNMSKTDRTIKAVVGSGSRKNINSDVQNTSHFALEQYSGHISKRTDLLNESPYNHSEEGVYDHLRDKISRKPEVEDTYQHASAGVSRDMSEYDTMENTVNNKKQEEASYDYSH